MALRRLFLPLSLALIALFLAPSSVFGEQWDRFPELKPREHFAIKRIYDGPKYRDLRSCFRRFDSRVGAKYYGAMVEVTSETGSRSRKENNALPYADALFEAWESERRLDPENDILVVFGLRNQSIAIHPGSKWTKIGFDPDTIAQTIEASSFEKHHRRRQYSDALCSLLTAVDLRLITLQQKMNERVGAIEQRLPELDTKLSALHTRVASQFAEPSQKDHPFGQKLLAKLAAARTQLDDATELAADDPEKAVQLADEVEAALQPVQSDLKIFNQDMERLDSVEAEVATLKQSIQAREDADAQHPKLALLQVAKCEELAKDIREAYQDKPWQVRDCRREAELQLAQADVALARAEVHRFYLRSLLPILGFALLILLFIGFVIQRTLRRRRALALLESDLAEWERRLASAAQVRDALELEAPTYFAPGRLPWVGESAEIVRPLEESGERIAALLSQGHELLSKARALHKKSNALNAKALEDALNLLRETPLSEETVTPDGADASALLGNLDAAQRDALSAVAAVRALQERHDTQSARAATAITRAEHALKRRRALHLPATHLSAPLETAAEAWQTGVTLSAQDPKQAAEILDRTADQLIDIADRAELGNQAVERVRGELNERAESLGQRVKQLRFAGVEVEKLGFAPEQELSAARRDAARVVEAVSKAQEEEAGDAVERIEANLDQLSQRLERVADTREQFPERLQALAARSRDLKEQLMNLRYALKSLANQDNPASYKASSEKVGHYQSQLNRLGKELEKAKKDHQLKRFLSAAQRLDTATALVDHADALLDELGNLETTLGVTQAKCEQLLSACLAQAAPLKSKAEQLGVDPDLQDLIAQETDALATLEAQAANAQLNWFDAREQLDSIQKTLLFLDAQADADLNAFDQAKALLERAQADLSAAKNSIFAQEYSEIITQAEEQLDGLSRQLQDPGGGTALLHTAQATIRACARAHRLAKSQRPLAENAHRQLAHANALRARIHNAPYGYDVTADCAPAKLELRAARNQLDLADFPRALAAAEAATAQLDLEDARAQALALRKFRHSQVEDMAANTTSTDLRAFGSRRSKTGRHTGRDEISEVNT